MAFVSCLAGHAIGSPRTGRQTSVLNADGRRARSGTTDNETHTKPRCQYNYYFHPTTPLKMRIWRMPHTRRPQYYPQTLRRSPKTRVRMASGSTCCPGPKVHRLHLLLHQPGCPKEIQQKFSSIVSRCALILAVLFAPAPEIAIVRNDPVLSNVRVRLHARGL